jgi:hypothetical protein
MAKVRHGGYTKRALGPLESELMLLERVKDEVDMTKMLRPSRVVDVNIIEENENKVAEELAEDVTHESLERGGSVRQTEQHHQELVVPLVRPECRLLHIADVRTHLMISRTEVQLGKEPCTMKLIQELFHYRDGKLVLDDHGIESPIVHAEPPGAVGLVDEQYRRGECRCAQACDALTKHVGALPL